MALPPTWSERDPHGPLAPGHGEGVGVDDGDLAGVDPEPVRDQLGEGGLVALAGRGDAGAGGHPAVRGDLHRPVLGREPGDLDVHRQADAELADVAPCSWRAACSARRPSLATARTRSSAPW